MGWVFDIQRFCVHDGPGLRTTVFLKGCPLNCSWCSNPEGQPFSPELMYNAARCMQCGSCAEGCAAAAITQGAGGITFDRLRCTACGSCDANCPTTALVLKGRDMTAGEVVSEVMKDADVYRSSGGGATVSGGEPFSQPDFLYEILTMLHAAGIHTAVETSAAARWEDIERCLPFLSMVLCDVKHADAAVLREWTGAEWEHIKKNIASILSYHGNVLIRIPVIPAFNTDDESFAKIAGFFHEMGVTQTELLPYHVLGEGKFQMLGRPYPGAAINADNAYADTLRLKDYLDSKQIHAEISG